ncbi:MAG: UDP-glucose 4-epimerase GalE [Prevotella sp.]|nr:UDP-glucose 4-epimerase GalE [Alistipes senegalensis]MCM1357200.1 UDP-glucose 4-epimerase GalE [Prevotella sp.]
MGKILVTGGTGFIGSHTCVELLSNGYEIVIVDNLSNSKEAAVDRIEKITRKKVTFYNVDVCDYDALSGVFRENDIEAVVHFAGLKAVGESVRKPLEYYTNNIYGTLILLKVMRENRRKKIVFSSSATVYGMNNKAPYTEDMPTSATNPYGYTKVMIEQILRDMCVADSEFSAVALRYFNPIGAHSSGLLGEDPNGIPNNLVPYIAQVASGKLEQLSVFGDDYDTPDGTGVRDYIHVMDLAAGHVCAIDYAMKNKGFEPVNLGTGKGSSVLEVVSAYEKACGKPIPKRITERRAGDIATCYADATKAKEVFGWEAKSDILQMCADSWNFTKLNPDGIQ